MIYFTASNSVLAFLKSQPTQGEFLHRAGVRENSYAGKLVLNLYDDIFVYSKNLVDEYLKYYKIEYPKFSVFADSFSSIPSSVLPKIDDYFVSYSLIIHFLVPGYLEEYSYDESDVGAKTLCKLLNTKITK